MVFDIILKIFCLVKSDFDIGDNKLFHNLNIKQAVLLQQNVVIITW